MSPSCFRGRIAKLTLAWLVSGLASWAAERPRLQSFHLYENFNGNTLNQWASYPPVQDVGYDPSLTPTSEYGAIGGRALMRVVRPPSKSRLRFGFIKRLNAVSEGTVTISFSYRLTTGAPAILEIGLAGGDGHRYSRHFGVVPGGWAKSNIQFRDLPAATSIEAVYITATFARADPNVDYRFLLDDFALTAAQSMKFEWESPAATAISPWKSFVSAASYAPGDTFAIRVKAPVRLNSVDCILKDQDNRTIAVTSLKAEEGAWVNRSVYTVKDSESPGIWHAELRGVARDGSELESDLRLLVRSRRSDTHPRLYFDASDRATLLARTRMPGLDSVWSHLAGLAMNSRNTGNIADGTRMFGLLDSRFLLPTLPGYFDLLTRGSDRILYNALESFVLGDKQSLAVAKSALLAVAGWQSWTPPWFAAHGQSTYYPVGELTVVVALAYDILYDDLLPSDRRLVRLALVEQGVKAAYNEYVVDNRIMANTSNWIGHAVGGAVVGALAVLEHDDDPALNIYLGGLLLKFEDHLAASYLSDGSYGEGISYQEFDLKTTTLALSALKRVYGIDYWKRTYVKDSLRYPLYTLATPSTETLDTGDTHPPTGYSISQIVQHSGQGVMRWYYDQFIHYSLNDFLFPVEGLPSQSPSAPVSQIFEQKGNAVFRTGWTPNDAVLLFRAGPNFNHNHADQGSFLLRALGETFVTEGGYSDYYKDPYYATYFSQASGHNTVLVNDDAASQDVADTAQFGALNSYPRITDSITSDFYDAVGSELTSVYKDTLKKYSRRIVFIKPKYVMIYDDLDAAEGQAARYDWLLHVNDRQRIHSVSSGVVYEGAKAAMGLRVLQPVSHKVEMENGRIPFSVLNPIAPQETPPQPGVLHVKSGAKTGSEHFLVLLSLSRSTEEALASISSAINISGSRCSGVKFGENEVFFNHNRSTLAVCSKWRTDAAAWTSTGPVLSAEQVTTLMKGERTMIKTDHPMNFAARYRESSMELITSTDKPVTIQVFTGFRPVQQQETYDSKAETVTIHCPAGRAEYHIR